MRESEQKNATKVSAIKFDLRMMTRRTHTFVQGSKVPRDKWSMCKYLKMIFEDKPNK